MASLLLACAAVLASQARAFTAPRARAPLRQRTAPLRAERVGAGYLERLSSYSDEVGYTLDAPTRYSIKDWWFNLQNIGSSSVLERIGGHLVANTVWSLVVVLCYGSWLVYAQDNEAPWVGIVGLDYGSRADDFDWFAPFTLSGGILGILLAFRTGQSYDRFWEGRQVWARVVNRVRAIARASRSYATFDDDDDVVSGVLLRWLAAFPLALKQHLRGERDVDAFDMVCKSNLQHDFNLSVRDSFDARLSAVLRELDESNRFVQKSAESTSM